MSTTRTCSTTNGKLCCVFWPGFMFTGPQRASGSLSEPEPSSLFSKVNLFSSAIFCYKRNTESKVNSAAKPLEQLKVVFQDVNLAGL